MSAINFICLVSPEEVTPLAEAFRTRLTDFAEAGRLESFDIAISDVDLDVQLRQQWERQHPEQSLGQRSEHQYHITVEGLKGSLNELTMKLSRLLTTDAPLPPDPVYREFDAMLEAVSQYPWFVTIEP
ncbi:hypothetical protein KRX51_09560 [Corynebacterium sp. TAE3-ERU12]|uniref:hypothetical protein n=1 Tax=Corynebacterium sp. TAE3-ERU12 TaxID=2849491 RepID=UPI001C437433|nr:hypothetical protein [Corynebacterium sp. TAE3-ERU12]MBV7296155.1 hypothetical protein [Corynebacterium sp. TAE3-ERU12]